MDSLQERQLVGLDYLRAVTTLLQRVRAAHPVKGLYEAADMQWWWRVPRDTDALGQLFWFDEAGEPEAAVIITQWKGRVALDPMFLPDADHQMIADAIERAIAHAATAGFGDVSLEVDREDQVQQQILSGHGFGFDEEGMVEAWLAADERPEVSSLHDGYRLTTRAEIGDRPHHMVGRNGPDVAERLKQTSLYRPDLDVVIVDSDDNYAAYGLFWFDPVTMTGQVEPMRTLDEHQRRGLARHVLTTGVNLLADAGAERIKIVFELSNPGASTLYPDVGFVPAKHTDAWAGNVSNS